MRALRIMATVVVVAFALTGCAGSPDGPVSPEPSESGSSTSAQRAYYDNVALFFELKDDLLGEGSDDASAPTVRGSWDEVDDAARQAQIEAGLAACASTAEPGEIAGGVLKFWLAASFLCEERHAEAEEALSAEYPGQLLDALRLSLLKGDAALEDVVQAVESCVMTLDIFYDLDPDTSSATFCWIMQANVNAEQGDEGDFLSLFLHSEEEQADADARFDQWAQDMGAEPNFLGDLADQDRKPATP